MVLLTMTPSIVESLNRLDENKNDDAHQNDESSGSNSTSNGEPSLKTPSIGNPISHGQILDIWRRLKNESGNRIGLEQLLRGAIVYVPPPPPKPEPTEEYKALMARLRREEEERSYERMLKKAPQESFSQRFPSASMARSFADVNRPSRASDIGDEIEHGDVQKQITLVINFLVSVFGCGVALWMAARWWSVPARLFLSLGGSILVAIAEVAVYSAYTWRMAEGEKQQKKRKEIKEIVQTWVVGEEISSKGNEEPKREMAEPETSLRRRIKGPT